MKKPTKEQIKEAIFIGIQNFKNSMWDENDQKSTVSAARLNDINILKIIAVTSEESTLYDNVSYYLKSVMKKKRGKIKGDDSAINLTDEVLNALNAAGATASTSLNVITAWGNLRKLYLNKKNNVIMSKVTPDIESEIWLAEGEVNKQIRTPSSAAVVKVSMEAAAAAAEQDMGNYKRQLKKEMRQSKSPLLSDLAEDYAYQFDLGNGPLPEIIKKYALWDDNKDTNSNIHLFKDNIRRLWEFMKQVNNKDFPLRTTNDLNLFVQHYFEHCPHLDKMLKPTSEKGTTHDISSLNGIFLHYAQNTNRRAKALTSSEKDPDVSFDEIMNTIANNQPSNDLQLLSDDLLVIIKGKHKSDKFHKFLKGGNIEVNKLTSFLKKAREKNFPVKDCTQLIKLINKWGFMMQDTSIKLNNSSQTYCQAIADEIFLESDDTLEKYLKVNSLARMIETQNVDENDPIIKDYILPDTPKPFPSITDDADEDLSSTLSDSSGTRLV